MSSSLTCGQCGRPKPGGTPEGHCPACLLALGLPSSGEGGKSIESPASAVRLPGDAISRFFGDYEILGEIARGGMGVVYRARQVSLNRPVALKMISAGPLASRGFVERFHIEAEAAAKLNHPNIVRVYEIGEHEGRHFFSMELFEGGDLGRRLADHVPPTVRSKDLRAPATGSATREAIRQRRIAQLTATIAAAVHHAHERGILHRDLKPANVLFDEHDEPHVTDFGLAKLVEEDSFLTQTGAVMGTPAYMAPEQASGEPAQLTTATDIYSLGALLYHLLTGRPPFQAPTALQTLREVVERDPVPPNKVSPAIDPDLSLICLKCLEKEPARRYSSARTLAKELENWLKGEPILVRPQTRKEQLCRWCRRNPTLAGLGGVILLLILMVIAISVTSFLRIKHAMRIVQHSEQNAIEKLYESYLQQARADRWSGRSGRRFEALRAITNAVAIHPSLELRNEAIASLALSDLYPVPGAPRTRLPTDRIMVDFPRNRYLLAETDGSISIRSLDKGDRLLDLPNLGVRVESVDGFSPDGRWLALAYHDGSRRVWNLEGRSVAWFTTNDVSGVAISPDSNEMAYGTADSHLVIRRLADPTIQNVWPLPTALDSLCWSPDGKRIAGFGVKRLLVLDPATGKLLRQFSFPWQPFDLAWHPDGIELAACGDDRSIHVFNVQTGKERTPFTGHQGAVTAIHFNPEGDLLASDSWDGRLRIWEFKTGKQIINAMAGPERIDFSPDGRKLAVYSYAQSQAAFFALALNRAEMDLEQPENLQRAGAGCALLFGKGGEFLATDTDTGLALWDAKTGRVLERMKLLPGGPLQPMAGDRDAIGWTEAGFYFFPIVPLEDPRAVSGPRRFQPEISLALKAQCPTNLLGAFTDNRMPYRSGISRDGRIYAVALEDRCYIFDLKAGRLQAVTEAQPWMKYVDVSPDGRWVATGGWHNPDVKIWDVASGREEKTLPADESPNVAFCPDGTRLVVSNGSEFRFWRTDSWEPELGLSRSGAGDLPGPMAFSADGKVMALAYTPRIVRLILVADGETLAQIEPVPDNEIVALALSPDGSELALTRVGAPTQIWHLGLIRKELASLKLDW